MGVGVGVALLIVAGASEERHPMYITIWHDTYIQYRSCSFSAGSLDLSFIVRVPLLGPGV